MRYRKKMGRKKSRKYFSKNANRTRKVNLNRQPMRGGWRF